MDLSSADTHVVDTVHAIRDRFGVEGLRDLVALATTELRQAEVLAANLAVAGDRGSGAAEVAAAGTADVADTQAWIAYTGHDD